MVLCFAVLVKILLLCSNQGTTQKVICARLLSSINSKYGYELEADESTISKLMTCKVGLSPEEIVNVIPVANFEGVKYNILAEIVPLLNRNTLPCGLVALKYIIDQDENIDSNSFIGNRTVSEITQLTNVDIADCITNLLYYTVLGIHNTKGASTIKLVTKEYVNGFQSQAGAVSFIQDSRSVPVELSKTLVNSNFNDVFTKVRSKAALELSNRSGIEMYYLDIAESCFDYCELSDYLLSCVGRYTVGSVLSQLNNYLGLSHAAPDYYEPSILERITNEYEKSLLQIPFEQDKYFLRSQKYVYDHMNEEVFFSYSSSTSMGKSFVMRTFIRDKIKKNDNCNFAVIVPTRALINEIFRALAEDMSCILRDHDYRIVTSSGNSIVKDKNKHRYIFVMTPERMMYQLIEYPDIPVHYVFIDEAQNISNTNLQSTYRQS